MKIQKKQKNMEERIIKKGAIFDFDGLMFDTESYYLKALDKVVAYYGKTMNPQAVRNQMGVAGKAMIEILRQDLEIDDTIEGLTKTIRTYFKDIKDAEIMPMPGLKEVATQLTEKGVKICVCSSNKTALITHFLIKYRLKELFPIIVSSDDVENIKPHPEPYLKAARMIELDPKDCLAFEDSSVGVESAREAGMDCIAIPTEWTKTMDFSRATQILPSLEDPRLMEYF